MTATVRPLGPADARAARRLGWEAFGVPPGGSLDDATVEAPGYRWFGAFQGEQLVATVADRAYDTWFHGRTLPTCGVASVTVAAEHRGAGSLGPLLRATLAAARDRGAVLATLFPSAPRIYRRSGFEVVTAVSSVLVPSVALGAVGASGTRVRRSTPADAGALRGGLRPLGRAAERTADPAWCVLPGRGRARARRPHRRHPRDRRRRRGARVRLVDPRQRSGRGACARGGRPARPRRRRLPGPAAQRGQLGQRGPAGAPADLRHRPRPAVPADHGLDAGARGPLHARGARRRRRAGRRRVPARSRRPARLHALRRGPGRPRRRLSGGGRARPDLVRAWRPGRRPYARPARAVPALRRRRVCLELRALGLLHGGDPAADRDWDALLAGRRPHVRDTF